jgi:hypothetical protein
MTATAGYSGTPLAKKLGMKPGMTVAVVGFLDDYAELVVPVPEGVELISLGASDAQLPIATLLNSRVSARIDTLPNGRVSASKTDILHIFTNSRDELFRLLDEARDVIRQDGMIWVSWYKKAAKLPTEITEDTIRDAALPMGLVDVKVCAVDEKWSGLKLVIRKENRK